MAQRLVERDVLAEALLPLRIAQAVPVARHERAQLLGGARAQGRAKARGDSARFVVRVVGERDGAGGVLSNQERFL